MTVTCVIADDQPPVLEFLSRYLTGRGIAVAASARDGAEALHKIEETRPGVALLDERMPGLSGIEVARALAAAGAGTRVLLYTGVQDPALLAEALDAGVAGFVEKDAPLEDLIRAVEVVAGGGAYIGTSTEALLLARRPRLTPRERQVLRLLAEGDSNERIAERLALPPRTVRTHVEGVLEKLGATTRVQAVAIALRESLIV